MTLTAALDTPADEPLDQLSGLLKAAADPLRLDILRLLGQSSFGVLELAEVFAVKQSGMSHHLKVLARAGWVETRREGNAVFYRRRLPQPQEPYGDLQQRLLATLDALPCDAERDARLEGIQQQRAAQSREFFSRNLDEFAERQDLIAEHHLYDDVAFEMLKRALPQRGASALEVGPGEGHFLLKLAQHFDSVSGLDCASALLEQAQQLLQQQGQDGVRLLTAEWPQAAAELDAQYDLLAFNMVLHHLPAPAQSIAAAAGSLADKGVLLITELCRHQQDWVKQRCGDLWLGFDEAELADWAARAGLEPLETQFLAQKNGFQIQIASFRKA